MDAGYRIIVRLAVDPDDDEPSFVAEAPELQAHAVAATRQAALESLEEEIDATLANMDEQGVEPPVPLDHVDAATVAADGNLTARVSVELHRELLLRARAADVELDVIVAELLGRAVGASRGDDGSRRDSGSRRRGRGRSPQGRQYHNIMEDGASFREYVRSLEDGNRGGGGRGGSGRGRR